MGHVMQYFEFTVGGATVFYLSLMLAFFFHFFGRDQGVRAARDLANDDLESAKGRIFKVVLLADVVILAGAVVYYYLVDWAIVGTQIIYWAVATLIVIILALWGYRIGFRKTYQA